MPGLHYPAPHWSVPDWLVHQVCCIPTTKPSQDLFTTGLSCPHYYSSPTLTSITSSVLDNS